MAEPDYSSAPQSRSGGIMAWMVHNRITPNLLMIVCLFGGMLCLINMKKEVFPNFSLDAVFVSMSYPGASPEEVEEGIIQVIEEAVRSIDGVDEVRSTAREGGASIEIEYDPGMNESKIYQEIQQEIDRIRTFPEDAEEPQVSLSSRRRDVIEVHFYGNVDEWSLRNVVESVRDRLLQYPAITQVDLEGARDFEVRVEVSMEKLRRYGMTLRDIARIVSQTSVDIPAGGVDTAAGEILVRFQEKRDWAREFANIPILTTAEGAVIHLSDIAEVVETFEDSDNANTFNGRRDIGIEIFRVGDESPIEVSEAVRAAMEEIGPTLPAGIDYDINSDRSQIFRQRRDLLLKNAAMGLILVLVLLGLFLEMRLAFWVTMGIPISFLGAMLFMPYLGVSINMISMFAFIIALGIVVDDAIVVGENVFEKRHEGLPPERAAIEGAREVGTPVLFSILTNNVAFLPILFIPGTFGKIWFVVPIVVISIFTVSLMESLFILPSHLAHLKDKPDGWLMGRVHDFQQVIAKLIRKLIYKIYAPILDVCMQLRYLVTACAIGLLAIVLAWAFSGRMGMTLMPTVEADFAYAEAALPLGSPIEKAIEIREKFENAAAEIVAEYGEQLTEGIVTNIQGERISTRFYLTPPGVRPLNTSAVVDLWREKVGEIPSAERVRFEADRGGPGRGASVTVELAHTSVEVLEAAGAQLAEYLEQFPQVKDIDDGYNPGKVQLDFTLKEEGRSLGLSSNDVASQVRALLYGAEAVRQQRGRNEVKVMVNLPEPERSSEYDVEQLLIRTPTGAFVPLRQIAEVSRGRAYNTIQRRDGRRTQTVTANVTPPEQTDIILRSLTEEILPSLRHDFPQLKTSFEGRQNEMRDSLSSLGKGFLLAILGIYVLLAIPFRSYTQPLIVLTALPFGVVGAIMGHIVMGYSLSVISVMGIIALGGVVVNDSLVMIDFANSQRAKGLNPYQAMHEAGVRRFRPIFLTTMTTFGGLAPMIFETSRQAKFMIPMAISLGYGLLFATAIMLILIPSLYMIREDIISFFTHEETGLPDVPLGNVEA